MSHWLVVLSWAGLTLGALSAALVVANFLAGARERMPIMYLVWPVTALWSGPLGAWAYFRYGHTAEHRKEQPFPVVVAKGATHCGSGCTLGDIAAELFFLAAPITVFGHGLFGAWIYDFIAAFVLGIVFQYFTIKPMRRLSPKDGLKESLKADSLSLTSWQVGMYGWMAIATFAISHRELSPRSVVFWFMMQIGMLLGFAAAYPVNWLLIRKGVKPAM